MENIDSFCHENHILCVYPDHRQTKTPRTAGLWDENSLCVFNQRLNGGGERHSLNFLFKRLKGIEGPFTGYF
jgi:hypothetical protein